MSCKLTIKDAALKLLVGKEEFDSIQDIIDSIKVNKYKGYTLAYENEFVPVSLEETEEGVFVNGKKIKSMDTYLKAMLKGYLKTKDAAFVITNLVDNLKEKQDTEGIEELEIISEVLTPDTEDVNFEKSEELRQLVEEQIIDEEAYLTKPLLGEQVMNIVEPKHYFYTNNNAFDSVGLKKDKDILVLPQTKTASHENVVRQFLNTIEEEKKKGVEFKITFERDSETQSDYFTETQPIRDGVVGVIYMIKDGKPEKVYFNPNSDNQNPNLRGELSLEKGNNITVWLPKEIPFIHFDKNPESVELLAAGIEMSNLRQAVENGADIELMDFDFIEQMPYIYYKPISVVIGQRLQEDVVIDIDPSGIPVVFADGVSFNVYARPLTSDKVEEIEQLLDYPYTDMVERDSVLTYLNTLYDSSSKNSPNAGDIYFRANGNSISLNSRIKITDKGVEKLPKPNYDLRGADRAEILNRATVNVDRAWLKGNVTGYTVKYGRITPFTEQGISFYSSKLFTHVRPTYIKENGKEVSRFIFSKNIKFNPRGRVKIFNKEEIDEDGNVEESKNYTLPEIWDKLKSSAKDRRILNMVELLEALRLESKVVSDTFAAMKVEVDPEFDEGNITLSSGGHTVRLGKRMFEEDREKAMFILFHEVIHGLTAEWLNNNKDSDIAKRLHELKKKVDKSKNKALSRYKNRDTAELFTMLIDESALKALDKEKGLAEQILDLFKEILQKLLGINKDSDMLLYDFLTVTRDMYENKPTSYTKDGLTHTNKESGLLSGDEIEFFSSAEEEKRKKEKKAKEAKIIESVGLNPLINGIDALIFLAVQKVGRFQDFVKGKIESATLYDTVVNMVNAAKKRLPEGESNAFFDAFADENQLATFAIYERNSKVLKVHKEKKQRGFIEITDTEVDTEQIKDDDSESLNVNNELEAVGGEGEEATSNKLVFEKAQLSSFEEANKQVRLLVRMLPKFEKNGRRYIVEDTDPKKPGEYFEYLNSGNQKRWAKFKKNQFGITEKCDAVPIWARLQGILAGSLSFQEMKDRMAKNVTYFPELAFLLNEIEKIENGDKQGALEFERNFEKSFKRFLVEVITVKQETKEITEWENVNGEQYPIYKDKTSAFAAIEGQSVLEVAKNELELNYLNFITEDSNAEYYNPATNRFELTKYLREKEGGVESFKKVYLDMFWEDTPQEKDFIKELDITIASILADKKDITITNINALFEYKGKYALNTSFKKTVNEAHINSPFVTSSMVNNAKGKKQSIFMNPAAILMDIELYNQSKNLAEAQLKSPRLNNPLFKYSISRQRLWLKDGLKTKDKIKVYSINGFKSESGKNTTTALADGDYLVTNLVNLVQFGILENSRAQMATTSLGFKIGEPFIPFTKDKDGISRTPHTLVNNQFFEYFKGELERMTQLKGNPKFKTLPKGHDGLVMFDWIENKGLLDKIKGLEYNGIEQFLTDNYEVIKEEIGYFLADQIDAYHTEFMKKVNPLERFNGYGTEEVFKLNLPGLTVEDRWKTLNTWTVYNYLISRIEEGILFHGDAVIFDKYFKRSNSIQSTGTGLTTNASQVEDSNRQLREFSFSQALGTPLQLGDYNGRATYGTGIIHEDEKKSSTAREIKEGILESANNYFDKVGEKNNAEGLLERIGKQSDKYGVGDRDTVNVGDGGGYAHPDFYRLTLKHVGIWTDAQELIHNTLILDFISRADEIFPEEDMSKIKRELNEEEKDTVKRGFEAMSNMKDGIFPVLKMAYRGNEAGEVDVIANEVFDKFALFALYPQFIGNKPIARAAFLSMTRDNLAYVKHPSGTKLKSTLGQSDDLKTLETNLSKGETSSVDLGKVRYELFLDRLFEQIQTSDHLKEKKTFGSQVRKLVMSGLKAIDGTYIDQLLNAKEGWIKTLYTYSDEQVDKIMSDFGAVKTPSGWDYSSLKSEDIVGKLLDQLKSEDAPKNTLEQIERVLKGDSTLEALMDSGKVENVLSNIVRKVAVQKVAGTMGVQVASSLFEIEESFKNRRGTNDLKTYRYNKDKTLAAECKFGLSGDFVKLLNLPEVKELTKSDDNILQKLDVLNQLLKNEDFVTKYEKNLTMVGYRIPTQGYNSMEVLIVREFMPPFYGSTLITHPEITTKSGTDYDYDKMSLFIPSLGKNGEYITTYEDKEALEAEKKELKTKLKNIKESADKGRDIVEKLKRQELLSTLPEGFGEELEVERVDINNPETFKHREDYFMQQQMYETLNIVNEKLKVSNDPSLRTQNKIIENLSDIILHPLNFWRLMLPNSADYLLQKKNAKQESGIFERIDEQTGIKVLKEGLGSSSYRWDSNYFKWKVVSLKDLLGVAAVWNTFYAVVQEHGLNLSNSYREDKFLEYSDYSISPFTRGYRDELFNEKPFLKAEVNSQFINVTVDGSSDDTMGFYNYTLNNFGAAVYLSIMKGMNVAQVHKLFHTPAAFKFEFLLTGKKKIDAIKQLIGLEVKSGWKNTSYSITNPTIEAEFSRVLEAEVERIKLEREAILKRFVDPNSIRKMLLTSDKGLIQVLSTIPNPTLKLSKLSELNLESPLETMEELSTLGYYLSAIEEQNKMRDVMKALNFDTSPDSTINKKVSREAAIERAQSDENPIVDMSVFNRLLNRQSGGFPMAFETSSLIEALSEKVYPVLSDPQYLNIVRAVGLKEGAYSNEERLFKKLNQDFLMALFQNFSSVEGKKFGTFLEEYISGEQKTWIPTKVKSIKKKLKEQGKQYRLLDIYLPSMAEIDPQEDRNTGEVYGKQVVNARLFQGNETDAITKNKLTDEFREMLNSKDEEVKEFAEKLAFVGMVQAGWTKSPTWFSDIIPSEFVDKYVTPSLERYKEMGGKEKQMFLALFKDRFVKQNEGFLYSKDGKGKWRYPNYNFSKLTAAEKKTVAAVNEEFKQLSPATKTVDTVVSPEINSKPTFSYKGKTIQTEFILSPDQVSALKELIDFVEKGKEDAITLQGSAGSGKTSVIGYLQKYFGTSFAYLAPTHAAVAELAFATVKTGNVNLPVTVASSITYDPITGKPVFTKKVLGRLGRRPVIVVDESSMLTERNVDELVAASKDLGSSLIFMGDSRQIPAVTTDNPKEKPLSKAFTAFDTIELTSIHRQKDNLLLDILNRIREQTDFKLFKPKINTEAVRFLSKREFDREYEKDVIDFPDDTMTITYTNNTVKDINKKAREISGRTGFTQKGDIVVGYLGYATKQIEKQDIANSIVYTITSIDDFVSAKQINVRSNKLKNLIDKGINGISDTAYTIYYQLEPGDSLTFDLNSEDFKRNNEDVSNYFREIHRLNEAYKKKEIPYFAYLSSLTGIGDTLRKVSVGNSYIYNPATDRMEKYDSRTHKHLKSSGNGSLLIEKDIDYGHAITLHKSQGTTIGNVYFDASGLDKAGSVKILDNEGNQVTTEMQALAYVAMSRASNKLAVYESNINFEEVNNSLETPTNSVSSQEDMDTKSTLKGKMTYSYGENKRPNIKSKTTFEAIKLGERTATTRYESDGNIEYWKQAKVGDKIEFESATGEKLEVVVTKPLHKLVGSGKTAEQWSKLEGWSVSYFNSKVKPKLNEAWQIEYKYVNLKEEESPYKFDCDGLK